MEFFNSKLNIDFMSKRMHALVISGAVSLLSVLSFIFVGFNLGIDFQGGLMLEINFSKEPDIGKVRNTLSEAGYKYVVQGLESPTNILIRISPEKNAQPAAAAPAPDAPTGQTAPAVEKVSNAEKVVRLLRQEVDAQLVPIRQEEVGAQVGEELRDDGGIAVLLALGGILMYVGLRFERRFAIGAIVATAHDVIVVLGMFSLFQIEFDLTVLAAILAVIGYSLNDTIVVFDRVRENFRKMRKATAMEVVNASMNQTLSRTIMTSFTTFLVVVAMLFVGPPVIFGFALALTMGIIVGTYSSIYIASVMILLLGVSREDLMPVAKEGEGIEGRGEL